MGSTGQASKTDAHCVLCLPRHPFLPGLQLAVEVDPGTLRSPRFPSPVAIQDRRRHFLLLVMVPKAPAAGHHPLCQLSDCLGPLSIWVLWVLGFPSLPACLSILGIRASRGSYGLTAAPLPHPPYPLPLTAQCLSLLSTRCCHHCRTCSVPSHQPRPNPSASAEPERAGSWCPLFPRSLFF